jgi:hypothetical protein
MVFRSVTIILCLLFVTACQTSPAHTSGQVTIHGDNASVSIGFNDYERALLSNYFKTGKKQKHVPPGLAKKNALPPGLAKRDRLPPGLQGRSLPDDLEHRLRRLPENYIRLKVGADVILMDKNTRVVFDVVYGVD